MFQLTHEEFEVLRSQFVTSKGRGGRRYLPYAFTEHGVIMAANVLNSDRAVQASVHIVRAFVKLRQIVLANADLADKLNVLEKKYDAQFKVVFEAIRQLMSPPSPRRKQIGFRPKLDKTSCSYAVITRRQMKPAHNLSASYSTASLAKR